jgi:hypothetical protein
VTDDEDETERNHRVAARSKRDLNRFLSCMRSELGLYVWVQEFQRRGVVHYHALCTKEVAAERVTLAWCRATGELDDIHAMRHAAQVEPIRDESAARAYLGRYLGKLRQKTLPVGVGNAGRWWGRSRRLRLVPVEEIVTCEFREGAPISAGVRIVRGVRRWLSRELGWKFRGGSFVSWGEKLAPRLAVVVRDLRAFYGIPRRRHELLSEWGWERVKGGVADEIVSQSRHRWVA